MTPFEFVFFLYAIMITLALTHLVSGWALAYRNASRIVWSAPYVLWACAVFLFTTGNLTSFWLMRDAPDWSAWLVLSNFAFAIVNYLVCVFIVPEAGKREVLDLAAFHEAERKRYLGALVLLELLAIGSNVANGLFASYDNWLDDLSLSIVGLLLTLAAIVSSRRWVQLSTAAMATAIGTLATIASSSIVGN